MVYASNRSVFEVCVLNITYTYIHPTVECNYTGCPHSPHTLSLCNCNKLRFSNPYTLARRPLIFQTMNSVRSNNLSLNYQRLTPLGCKDKGIRTFFGVNSLSVSTFKIRFKLKFTGVLTFNINLNCSVKKIC